MTMVCDSDDCCKRFVPLYPQSVLPSGHGHRPRPPALALSDIMTILASWPWSHSRTFTHDYTEAGGLPLLPYFPPPGPVHPLRGVAPARPRAPLLLCASPQGALDGGALIDATPLVVWHNRRINAQRVLAGWATRGQTSMGWLYGCQLQRIVHDEGELLAFCRTRPWRRLEARACPRQAALWAALWRPRVSAPGLARSPLGSRARTLDQHPHEQEESAQAVMGPGAAAHTRPHRHSQRPMAAPQPDGAHAASPCDGVYGQSCGWLGRLELSAEKTFLRAQV